MVSLPIPLVNEGDDGTNAVSAPLRVTHVKPEGANSTFAGSVVCHGVTLALYCRHNLAKA